MTLVTVWLSHLFHCNGSAADDLQTEALCEFALCSFVVFFSVLQKIVQTQSIRYEVGV